MRLRSAASVTMTALCALCVAGCITNDPNRNQKARFLLLTRCANHALRQAGSDLEWPDYDVMRFSRSSYDDTVGKRCRYTLYDFVKSTDEPGPQRFVVAYNHCTRTTSLRSDLRSNIDMERLPVGD